MVEYWQSKRLKIKYGIFKMKQKITENMSKESNQILFLIFGILLILSFFNCRSALTQPVDDGLYLTETNIIASNDYSVYYGGINGYVTLKTNLLNYKFFVIETNIQRIKIAITNDIYTNHLETNVIETTALTNRYFTNHNISTNFGDYLARTNDSVVYICTSSIEQSNNIYYYSNLFYSLFSSNLSFYPNGQVSNGTLDRIQFINGVNLIGDISFYPNGQVSNGTLGSIQFINGITLRGDISFYSNGRVENGLIPFAARRDGFDYTSGRIYFMIIIMDRSNKDV